LKNSGKILRKLEIDPLKGDLSHLLKSGALNEVKFELKPKNKSITIRLNEELLKALKAKAKTSGLEYQKLIRLTLERLFLKAS
jgi:predicted DNA binding CopG/RHH family protein